MKVSSAVAISVSQLKKVKGGTGGNGVEPPVASSQTYVKNDSVRSKGE
ncbi:MULTISPECIES: hypothetical protein [unclassified Pseudoalteromonas]|nr:MULTISPECIES: hypothetical protein [unclassified Pseudoalteromonas]MCF2827110.1 hypothetical protein [Pseudoalteromonas sp. OF5H-5]MCF2834253.1 hypothetical protein [Pseudoalteromonas sp. DL2-H6]MCF2925877.1 hypothetical protein [Pseudoalteromonas sp. DL2-H1]